MEIIDLHTTCARSWMTFILFHYVFVPNIFYARHRYVPNLCIVIQVKHSLSKYILSSEGKQQHWLAHCQHINPLDLWKNLRFIVVFTLIYFCKKKSNCKQSVFSAGGGGVVVILLPLEP